MLIKLTTSLGSDVWVNPTHIVSMRALAERTTVFLVTDNDVIVRETPEEIVELIREEWRGVD